MFGRDLYAVGAVAYWLLTGRLVFEGLTDYETLLEHVNTAAGAAFSEDRRRRSRQNWTASSWRVSRRIRTSVRRQRRS